MSLSDEQRPQEPSASKKIRMTMACERCRSKKVKCDFAHPSCSRCQQAKAQCSYDGSATQVENLFNLVKLNETVDLLQKRIQSIESDMKDVSTHTQFVADEFRLGRPTPLSDLLSSRKIGSPAVSHSSNSRTPKWSLSLTSNGLRIDTNIVSIHALYDILAAGSGMASPRLNMDDGGNERSTSTLAVPAVGRQGSDTSSQESMPMSAGSSGSDSISSNDQNRVTTTITRKKSLWKTKLKTFPLYSTWEPSTTANGCRRHHHPSARHVAAAAAAGGGSAQSAKTISRQVLDRMMDIYTECLLCFPCADPDNSVAVRYRQGRLDPLLKNMVFAWTARHGAIYHDLFPGQDPNEVGAPFFKRAKELLKDRFMHTSVDTMHSLLIMYIYAIGRPVHERSRSSESEAYMYLGLAIRMCLDMKMYIRKRSDAGEGEVESERSRRFFWAVYFLETLCTIHSDRVFSLPPEDTITVGFPTIFAHEEGEKRWRVLFTSERFKITRIYRNMLTKTAQERPLLLSISALEKELHDWHGNLPEELQYTRGDIHRRNWASMSFREQACVKLNSEYHFQLCQLYRLFTATDLPAATANDSRAIELVAEERCLESAATLVELLECYARLEQRWCHFSLETVMMPTLVCSRLFSDPGVHVEKKAWAHEQLDRIVHVLGTCPVRHHRYVAALVQRIKKLLARPLSSVPAAGGNSTNDEYESEFDLSKEEEEEEDDNGAGPVQEKEASSLGTLNASHAHADATTTRAIPVFDGHHPAGEPKPQASDVADVFQLSEFLYAPSLMAMCHEPVSTAPAPAPLDPPLLLPPSSSSVAGLYEGPSSLDAYFAPHFMTPPPPPPQPLQMHEQQQQQPPSGTLFEASVQHCPASGSSTLPFDMMPMHQYTYHKHFQ
ncbi:hypothetical protein BX666DRAFT_1885583 [Dichotomocladium elegans]|nr:hypothetical protein BX666DRAFT_1885583 [Dichotomocladium elegans]